MAFSGWQYVKVVQGGESFTALTEGYDGLFQHTGTDNVRASA
jgi:hypothetical protein